MHSLSATQVSEFNFQYPQSLSSSAVQIHAPIHKVLQQPNSLISPSNTYRYKKLSSQVRRSNTHRFLSVHLFKSTLKYAQPINSYSVQINPNKLGLSKAQESKSTFKNAQTSASQHSKYTLQNVQELSNSAVQIHAAISTVNQQFFSPNPRP